MGTTLTVHGFKLDTFTVNYLATMLWASGDDGEFDDVAVIDLPLETIRKAIDDCTTFQALELWQEASAHDDAPTASDGEGTDGQGGHDFWLTRCGHGAGFWDGDWPEPYGDALTTAAQAFGTLDPYKGDDGQVYFA